MLLHRHPRDPSFSEDLMMKNGVTASVASPVRLDDVIAGFQDALARAAAQADSASASFTEHYRSHPVLQTFAVPYVRLLTVDLELKVALADSQAAAGRGDVTRLTSIAATLGGMQPVHTWAAAKVDVATALTCADARLAESLSQFLQRVDSAPAADSVIGIAGLIVDHVANTLLAAEAPPSFLKRLFARRPIFPAPLRALLIEHAQAAVGQALAKSASADCAAPSPMVLVTAAALQTVPPTVISSVRMRLQVGRRRIPHVTT
jgi:hypothetical protein